MGERLTEVRLRPARHCYDAGQRFGNLMVVRKEPNARDYSRWLVRCDCGLEFIIRGTGLRTQRMCNPCTRTKHGHTSSRRNGTQSRTSRTFNSWAGMIARCTNPRDSDFRYYGGRGIGVCERWRTFASFLADMGERPAGTSIDRFPDNDGNYEPGNCRWATPAQQTRNSRATKLTLSDYETIRTRRAEGSLIDAIAADFKISPGHVSRIARGLTSGKGVATHSKEQSE